MPTVKEITENIKNVTEKITDTGKKLQHRYKRYADKRNDPDISFSDEAIIETVIQIPTVRIDRNTFLSEQFRAVENSQSKTIFEKGPVEAGCDRGELKKKATALAQKRITQTLLADIPDEFIKKTAVPYETLLFYSSAVQHIQEIAYLYGENDFWNTGESETERTVGRLHLYYSVMTGSGKAEKALKLLSSSVTSKSFNKLTENFLEKTVYQSVFRPDAKVLKIKTPKTVFRKIVSGTGPAFSNALSDGISMTKLLPMAGRLIKTLDEAQFAYSAADFEADWYEIEKEVSTDAEEIEST